MTPIVLYTDQMEPITVIELPQWFLDKLYDKQLMKVPVMSAISIESIYDPIIENALNSVDVWAESLYRKGNRYWLLFTNDENLALRLKSDVLPGQRKAFQDEYKRGFISGMLSLFN